jgi:hypothetical protein
VGFEGRGGFDGDSRRRGMKDGGVVANLRVRDCSLKIKGKHNFVDNG